MFQSTLKKHPTLQVGYQTLDEKKMLTVSQLTQKIKNCLEKNIGFVWVVGEISDIKYHSSGHIYFGLRDANSQINVVIWKEKTETLNLASKIGCPIGYPKSSTHLHRQGWVLENGMKVAVFGSISCYVKRGIYQLSVMEIEPLGIGILQLRYEELKRKLFREGLFEESHKKPIPLVPSQIAIITSISGAAILDILKVMATRFSKLEILIYNVQVQGENAPMEIVLALKTLNNNYPNLDIIIIARGGGSLEDLWAFNEEIVARAIYNSKIPVITGIGHEIDYTIADFVADKRAKTPTDAANVAVPKYSEILSQLQHNFEKLKNLLARQIELNYQKLDKYSNSYVFNKLRDLLYQYSQRVDERFDALTYGVRLAVKEAENKTSAASSRLEALNPRTILKRGYSITTRGSDGKVIKNASTITKDEEIISELAEGRLYSKVRATSSTNAK